LGCIVPGTKKYLKGFLCHSLNKIKINHKKSSPHTLRTIHSQFDGGIGSEEENGRFRKISNHS
jgi:hypothetical protein